MTENDHTSHAEPQVEPTLRGLLEQPKGVLQKNLKMFVYLGAALLVIVAALFSSTAKKTPAQQAAAKGQPPQPTLQDNTDNNVQDLKNQVQAEREKEQQAAMAAAAGQDPALASATPAQQAAAAAAFGPSGEASTPCGPGRRCGQAQQGGMPPQLTPAQQQAQLIAAKERERADNSRFASNLVYSRIAEQQPQQPQTQSQVTPGQPRPGYKWLVDINVGPEAYDDPYLDHARAAWNVMEKFFPKLHLTLHSSSGHSSSSTPSGLLDADIENLKCGITEATAANCKHAAVVVTNLPSSFPVP
jgi:hypothetical protein